MPPPLRPGRPLTPVITRPLVVPRSAVPLPGAPTAAARLDALITELRQLRSQVNRYVHRQGVILRELSTGAMISAAGAADFDGVLEQFELGGRLSALKYIAVADHFSEDEAAQLGVERGYAIVRGAAAMPQPIEPRALLAKNPVIGPSNVRLAAANLRAVLGWVDSLHAKTAPAPSKRAYEDADSARDRLHRRFAAAGLGESKMRVVRKGGGYVVRVELAVDDVTALARLVKAK